MQLTQLCSFSVVPGAASSTEPCCRALVSSRGVCHGQRGAPGIPAGWGTLGKGPRCFGNLLDPKAGSSSWETSSPSPRLIPLPCPISPGERLGPTGFSQDIQPLLPVFSCAPSPFEAGDGHPALCFILGAPLALCPHSPSKNWHPVAFFPICGLPSTPVPAFCPCTSCLPQELSIPTLFPSFLQANIARTPWR